MKLKKFFLENKGGLIGFILLLLLLSMTTYSLLFITPGERLNWNNPLEWINNPKDAAPFWINFFLLPFNYQLPEHVIFTLNDSSSNLINEVGFKMENKTFNYNFHYDDFPSEFSIPYNIQIGQIPPGFDLFVKRPDGLIFRIYSYTIESNTYSHGSFEATKTKILNNSGQSYFTSDYSQRIFSTSQDIKNSLEEYSNYFKFPISSLPSEKIIFSDASYNKPLKGNYKFIFSLYSFDNDTKIKSLNLIMDGKVYGLLGTDESRRDINFGILIGTPVALFIGITVAITSSIIGLFYGLIAGYKERKTGTFMLTIIDIFFSLPVLVLLIVISVHFGSNLLFLIGLFIIFGWPGLALLNRTFSIQIKNYQYVEASKLMGESDFKIIIRHIVPQLLPFTLANFALSVPAAILAESALSFLGLGDPSFPTWGQMLQDAHFSSAEIRGFWWWVFAPGLMISITSLAFILIGRAFENFVKINRKW